MDLITVTSPPNLIHFCNPPPPKKKYYKINKNKPNSFWLCLVDQKPKNVSFSVSDLSFVLFIINEHHDALFSELGCHQVDLISSASCPPFFISYVTYPQLHNCNWSTTSSIVTPNPLCPPCFSCKSNLVSIINLFNKYKHPTVPKLFSPTLGRELSSSTWRCY